MPSTVNNNHSKQVQAMFGRIAGRYDLLNSLITLGQDRVWRRRMIRIAALKPTDRLLDIGTGTGKIAVAARRQYPSAFICAGDFTFAMLTLAEKNYVNHHIHWFASDALSLPFPEKMFDIVTSGYLIRNVPDIQIALKEQFRVLRPGGKIICLDTTPPTPNCFGKLIRFYLKYGIPILGRLFSDDASAYQYLPETTAGFIHASEVSRQMALAGFEKIRYRFFMFNTQALHVAVKPNSFSNQAKNS